MLADQFTKTFREEHRIIRDVLLELVQAFKERDKEGIQSLLNQAAIYTGPHFRYEEEALYPALIEIFGEEYIKQLYGDHDRAIGTAKKLMELANQDSLTDDDIKEAIRLIRRILPHVSDCDGLSIMVEKLSAEEIKSIFDARDRSLNENLDLIEWADQVRNCPSVISEC